MLWGCRVPVGGALGRPVLFMSKFWMNKVWAWDNTFNALALARHDPALAWDQLHIFFDHQGPNGVLPDTVSDLEAIPMHVKPPVHGWAILRLIDRVGEAAALPHLARLYDPLRRLTEWWFAYRDHDGNGVCQYHHGNDSGWDNGTSFDIGCPNESPDLATWLVLQCDALARMAELLERPAPEAAHWRAEGERRLSALLANNVRDGRFVARLGGTDTLSSSGSLLLRFPLLLGKRLPPEIYANLLEDLRPDGPFLTRRGLASEAPASPLYEADGYWRGPVWGVSNFILFDAMVAAGETDRARELAARACGLCVENPGFWENYDALTGRGLRCPAYSWTAATFLLMAEWLAGRPA
jgi:glycogen debranching enzyme